VGSGISTLSSTGSRSQVKSKPEVQKEDAPASAAGLAQLQRIDGAFPPSRHIYAVVGGDAARRRFKGLSSQSTSPEAEPVKPSESPAEDVAKKEDGVKATTGSFRRLMGPFRHAPVGSPPTGSKASKKREAEEPSEWDPVEVLWATLLVLAYLEAKLANEADVWVLMAEKARAWIATAVSSLPPTSTGAEGGDVAKLVQTMEVEAKKVVEKL